MEEAAAPSRPAWRNVFVPRSESAKSATGHRDLGGRRLLPIPSAGQGHFTLQACWRSQPLP
eukprot:2558602-Alexandrium_andersonii.AAC.1